jgi:lysozyme
MSISPNLSAFLRAIRLGEGTADEDGYRRLCGGGELESFERHPAYAPTKFRVWLPRYQVWSTAAGAYQINKPTWESLGHDRRSRFDPDDQDKAAVALIRRYRALDDVERGDIRSAILKCSKCWASLPGSPYGQRIEPIDRVLAEYKKHGGTIAA